MMDADCTRYPFLSGRYGIKVCRIEPENNVELILSTFARYPKFPLVVVGNWEEKRYGRALRKRFEGYSHIHMLDPIYDSATLDILRGNAAFYLHGHSAGGTNPSLVEAMSLGLPVFAYDVGFNRETTQNAASYFRNQIQLMSLLEAAAPERLAKMGQRLHEIACTRYTWQAIVRGYEALIETGIEWAEVPEGSTYLSEVAIPAARQD
jgi:glycosyltransferase involved in cell wall biosynthesis